MVVMLALAACAKVPATPEAETVQVAVEPSAPAPPEPEPSDAPARERPAVIREAPVASRDAMALAERFFEQGRAAMARGNFADACVAFEKSARLDPAVGTLANLAMCQERLGRTAEACR